MLPNYITTQFPQNTISAQSQKQIKIINRCPSGMLPLCRSRVNTACNGKMFLFVCFFLWNCCSYALCALFIYLFDLGFMESMNERKKLNIYVCISTSTHSSASAPLCVSVCLHAVSVPVCTWVLGAASFMFS